MFGLIWRLCYHDTSIRECFQRKGSARWRRPPTSAPFDAACLSRAASGNVCFDNNSPHDAIKSAVEPVHPGTSVFTTMRRGVVDIIGHTATPFFRLDLPPTPLIFLTFRFVMVRDRQLAKVIMLYFRFHLLNPD